MNFPLGIATTYSSTAIYYETASKYNKLHLVLDCKISSAQCELRNVALHLLLTPKLTFNQIDAYGGVFSLEKYIP